jgi:hypothetical protein
MRDGEVLFAEVPGLLALGEAGLLTGLARLVVLAGENALPERRPRRDGEIEGPRHGQKVRLDGALDQRILDLQSDKRRPAARVRQVLA